MGIYSVTVPRVSNGLRSNLILGNLNQASAELLKLQNQLSSGRRIQSPSDDPFDATVAGQLQSFLEQKERFNKNIQDAMGVLSMADTALGQAGDLLTRAKETGLEEIGVTATSQTRHSSATVIDEILNEMVNLGNTEFVGRHIFAGRDTLSPPFENVGTGVYFAGDTGTVDVSIDYSSTSSTSVDAAAAFGAVSSQVRGTADLDPAITPDTLLADLNRGAGVKPGAITISDGTNVSTIDLSGARTVGDVIAAINAGTPPATTISINAAGDGFRINAPGGSLTVKNTLGGSTASDLGIYCDVPAGPVLVGQDTDPVLTALTPTGAVSGVDWLSGLSISNGDVSKTIDFAGCTTMQEILNKINSAGLKVEARINDTGKGIDVVSRLSGAHLSIGENGGTTAEDLGIRSMNLGTELSSLNEGRGVTTVPGDDVTITLKDGTSFGVDLSSAQTIGDVIAAINAAPGNPGTLNAALAVTGNGIELTDTSGGSGDLEVSRANQSNAAADLGLLASTSGTVLTGADANPIVADGVFSHLLGLRDALLADDDTAISLYTGKLEDDLPRLLETRASIGARRQRMETVKDRIASETIELQSMLSDRIDLDYSTAIVRYSTLQSSFEASLKTAGSLLQMSLINFLR